VVTTDPARADEGFTLIELLMIVIIIGILAAIVFPTVMHEQSKAAGATAISDLQNAATAEEVQLADSGSYASSLTALDAEGFRLSPGTQFGVAAADGGYCEVADQNGTYWWFDSTAGGVQRMTTTALTPPATANGVCSSAAPSELD
jgi:prepilin-type N-terminal cleavage/methylation domain-containing protein